jgi:hypothetical protein
MPLPDPVTLPIGGFQTFQHVPSKVHRRSLSRPVYKRRTCSDNRAYFTVPFTILGVQTVADFSPMWRVDQDYWIARLTANVGLHNESTHPNDGTPGGSSIKLNMRRVKGSNLSDDNKILVSNDRLNIAINHHQDSINDEDDGAFDESDFSIKHLAEGDHIYPTVTQVGSGRPGTHLVISIVLVPIP